MRKFGQCNKSKNFLRKAGLWGLGTLCGLCLSQEVGAQSAAPNSATSTSTVVTKMPSAEELQDKDKKSWLLELGLERASNMLASDQPDAETSDSLSAKMTYKLSDKWSVAVDSAVEKQQTKARDTLMGDLRATLGLKTAKLSDDVTLSNSLVGTVPTSQKSQEDKLKTAVAIGNTLKMEKPFGTFAYSLSLKKNFHEYEFSREGKPNIEYVLGHRVLAEVPVYGNFSLSCDFAYRTALTYSSQQKGSFSFNADLSYAVNQSTAIYVGTTNEGSALKVNGQDSNIEVFNDRSSLLRLGISHVL